MKVWKVLPSSLCSMLHALPTWDSASMSLFAFRPSTALERSSSRSCFSACRRCSLKRGSASESMGIHVCHSIQYVQERACVGVLECVCKSRKQECV